MKKNLALLLACSMMLGLTACGGGSKEASSAASEASTEAPAETPAGQGVSSQTAPPSSDGAVTTEPPATTAPSAPQTSNP